jgi:hypothetical protein
MVACVARVYAPMPRPERCAECHQQPSDTRLRFVEDVEDHLRLVRPRWVCVDCLVRLSGHLSAGKPGALR